MSDSGEVDKYFDRYVKVVSHLLEEAYAQQKQVDELTSLLEQKELEIEMLKGALRKAQKNTEERE